MAINWKNVWILKDDLRTWVSGDDACDFVESRRSDFVKKTRKGTIILKDKGKEFMDDADVMRLLERELPKRVNHRDVPTITPVKKGGAIRGGATTINSPAPPYEKVQFVGFKNMPNTIVENWTVHKKGDPSVKSKVEEGRWIASVPGWFLILPNPQPFNKGDFVILTAPRDPNGHELEVEDAYVDAIQVVDGPSTAPLHDAAIAGNAISKLGYNGPDSPRTDMDARALIMKNAIKTGHGVAENSEKILKIFVAPEFYWRNADGAYPLEAIPDVLIRMSEETRNDKYKDWLFVLGTAIGYLPHEDAGEPLKYRFQVTKVDGGNVLTVNRTGRDVPPATAPHQNAQANVSVAVWERIPEKTAFPWKVHQGTANAEVTKVTRAGKGSVTVELNLKAGAFKTGEVVLEEPIAMELFNVALVQKGGPASLGRGGLREAIVYKEFASHIDFISDNPKGWYDASGINRKILLGGKKPVMLPTEGATDVLSQSRRTQNRGDTGQKVSEVNVTGYGGGSVMTIDGITFGVEVCRDHLQKRLHKFYFGDSKATPAVARAATQSDPRVQVQLIPSWGAWIDRGGICCVENGLIFNVDGSDVVTAARVFNAPTTFTCKEHPSVTAPANDVCTHCRNEKKYCPACNNWPASACTCTPKKPALNKDMNFCEAHNALLYPGDTCPTCASNGSPYYQSFRLGRYGSEIAVKQKDVAVDPGGKKWEDYFIAAGLVDVYEPAAIPPPQKTG